VRILSTYLKRYSFLAAHIAIAGVPPKQGTSLIDTCHCSGSESLLTSAKDNHDICFNAVFYPNDERH